MLSKKSRRYLLELLRRAHDVFYCPLIWSRRKREFVLDKTSRFKRIYLLLLFNDISAFLLVLALAVENHLHGLDYVFTLFLFFLLTPMAQNAFLDFHMLCLAPDFLQFFNTFWKLTHSRQGNGNTQVCR